MIPTKIAFEKKYSDDSGVEFAVRYEANDCFEPIEIEHVNTISIPLEQLDWIIDALCEVRLIVNKDNQP